MKPCSDAHERGFCFKTIIIATKNRLLIKPIKNIKMKKIVLLAAFLHCIAAFSQEKNFIDKPYLEVQGKADTLVTPNRIHIDVLISEKDVKGKKSVEELENGMLEKLKALGIDVAKNVAMQDMMSNYKKFFLKQTDIQKAKSYSILVYDATTTAKVFIGLEEIGISNVRIDKLEHSDEKKLKLLMNSKAIENAKANAISFTKPLGQKVGNAIYIGTNNPGRVTGVASGIRIRGAAEAKRQIQGSEKYDSGIEFEKITVSSEIGARFALE
jgi:uncharacterized protein YggE